MGTPVVKFNTKDKPEFFKVLNSRVNQHFKDKGISRHANFTMFFKSFFMVALYFTPLILMITGIIQSYGMMYFMWVLMGLGMSGIGLSVMHDANHGAYSKNKNVNAAMGFLLNFLGGWHVNWKIQHNVLHHSFTNIHEHDDDIAKPIIRFSPNQEKKPMHKFQVIYAPMLYSIMTLFWIVLKDFEQIKRYNEKGLLEKQGYTPFKAISIVAFHKIWYMVLTLGLPIYLTGFSIGSLVLGFIMMHLICGLILAAIFQPAHVIEETSFFKVDERGSVENNWAIHQLLTTANFANEARALSWFVGGLNYQIEHHLFPHVCHVHYRDLSKIVKTTAAEFDIPYYEHKTFYGAVKSHMTLLYKLGTGKYEKEQALQAA